MGKDYDNNLKGVLFRNREQRDGKQDPDMRGTCEIDGVQYWLDGWTHVGKDGSKIAGQKFLSLKFRAKDEQRRGGGGSPQRDRDEQIPF